MTALSVIQPIILLHRPLVPENLPYPYDRKVDQDPRDPCVWIFEGEYSSSFIRYSRFYATEVIAMLESVALVDLSTEDEEKQVGCIKHESSRVHGLTLKAVVSDMAGRPIDLEITLSGAWFKEPHRKIADLIERLRNDMRAECMQVWPETRALKTEFLKYIDRLSKSENFGAINFNPISIDMGSS